MKKFFGAVVLSCLIFGSASAEEAAQLISRAASAFDAGQYAKGFALARQARDTDEKKFQAAAQQALKEKPFDAAALETALEALVKKSKKARRKALGFDQEFILAGLAPHAANGFAYRFDDNFKHARISGNARSATAGTENSAVFAFNFDDSDAARLKSKRSKAVVENGILAYRQVKYDYLESTGTLDIDKDLIGEIVLRVKSKNAKRFKLAWSRDTAAVAGDAKTGTMTIDTIPDNRFHTYRINAKNVLRHKLSFGDRIKKIFICPSNIPGDDVQIDFIRFIAKTEKYRQAPAGITYETIAKEMRRAVYMNAPLKLSYDVALPEKPCTLAFGTGMLLADSPMLLHVNILQNPTAGTGGKAPQTIYTARLTDPQAWTHAAVDMSAWRGKKITVQFALSGSKNNVAFISNPCLYSAPAKKMNFIIVLEDALRADHMSCYGHTRETTPVKDAWIKGGVQFLNAFSQATNTRPSCPSIMTSLYPTATGVWNFTEMLDDNYLTLAEILRSQGFETASFIQNDNAGPLAGLHQGFSYLFDQDTLGKRAAGLYADRLFEWMDAHKDRNYFIYLHAIDPHGVYDPPRPFDHLYRAAHPNGKPVKKDSKFFDPPWLENPTVQSRNLLYDGEIRYNDFCFDTLLKKLEQDSLSNDTAIIFIADHGEHLGEHDLWGHNPPGYRQVVHVPLLMVYPAVLPKGLQISQPVQMIDIMPTVLDLAGIDAKDCILQGDSLLPLIERKNPAYWNNRVAFSEEVSLKKKSSTKVWSSVFFQNRHILHSNKITDGLTGKGADKKFNALLFRTRIFDYVNDPQESKSLPYDLADIVYLPRLKTMIRQCQQNNISLHETLTRGKQQEIKYEPGAVERLKGLGYIQ